MNSRLIVLLGAILLAASLLARAGSVTFEHNEGEPAFRFKSVPPPSRNDAATVAVFSVVDGEPQDGGGSLAVLHDGKLPTGEDAPEENFYFAHGTDGGRIKMDLGSVIAIKEVCTYSWHTSTRAPQVYTLYASDGAGDAFKPTPKRGTDPASCGWRLLAHVDTRPASGEPGGQYGVAISDPSTGVLGRYRYLLFDISKTEDRDPFGNTFYSEIDVVDANGPTPIPATTQQAEPILKSFSTADGQYHFVIDATAAPDLLDWADTKLRPVVQEWYPKLVEMLPSEGFVPATNITLRFRNNMGGTPAATGGSRIDLNTGWYRNDRNAERIGSVVHELVHVVQRYGRVRSQPGATRPPGWLVEGIADYLRWFVFEPQSKGAEITQRNFDRARYNSSYRITANFLNWVTQTKDKDIVAKLNAAARQGSYSEELWKQWTGQSLPDLGGQWKQANQARLYPNG